MRYLSLLFLAVLGTSAAAERRQFVSGVGATVGLGPGNASTRSTYGAFDGSLQQHTGSWVFAGTAVEWLKNIPSVNFCAPASSVKSHGGLAFISGVIAQNVAQSCVTTGLRWIYGSTGTSASLRYGEGSNNLFSENALDFLGGAPHLMLPEPSPSSSKTAISLR